jgi:hypothetical protein
MKRIILLVTVALLMALSTGVAKAQPADEAPVGPGGHYHHVITGNGGCVNIDSVRFEKDDRGLHQGANKSGSNGPAHDTCPP